MRRILIVAAIFLWSGITLFAAPDLWAEQKTYLPYSGPRQKGDPYEFSKPVYSVLIDTGWTLLGSMDTVPAGVTSTSTFTQMQRDTTIEVEVIGSDSAYVLVEAILAEDRSKGFFGTQEAGSIDTLTFAVPPSGTVVSTLQFRYFDSAVLKQESASTVIVYSSGDSPRGTLLDSIPAGRLDYPVALRFGGGQHQMVIDVVECYMDSGYAAQFELRLYPDDADARDMADGYERYGPVSVNASTGYRQTIQVHREMPTGSLAAVFTNGSTAGQQGGATIRGRRWK